MSMPHTGQRCSPLKEGGSGSAAFPPPSLRHSGEAETLLASLLGREAAAVGSLLGTEGVWRGVRGRDQAIQDQHCDA